jgi:hypothetical protein
VAPRVPRCKLTSMAQNIRLEQALFGYRDGHNLLVASISLPPRARQLLATVTDSSGPAIASGLEVAFTGMPVPGTDYYAVFGTWPAPEMPRPGCVWSHVVLIGLTDLARLSSLAPLSDLCLRPTVPLSLASYEQPLLFDESMNVMRNKQDKITPHSVNLLRALYEHPQRGIVVLDDNCETWKSALFEIWAQQWPRLRREFAFSTGSLGDRRAAGVSFDVQVAPLSSERLWRRSEFPTVIVGEKGSTTPITPPDPWVGVAMQDLETMHNSRFRQFLNDNGSDAVKPRIAFAKLAATYEMIERDPPAPWSQVLMFVASEFPGQSEANRLKSALLSLPSEVSESEKLDRAWSIACLAADGGRSEAFNRITIDLSEVAAKLWLAKRDDVIGLLNRVKSTKESPTASAFVKAIAGVVNASDLNCISSSIGHLIPILITQRPSLSFDPETWRLPEHLQSQIVEALLRLGLDLEAWTRVVQAMLTAGTSVGTQAATLAAGPSAMDGVFRWLETCAQSSPPPETWRAALSRPATAALSKDGVLLPTQLAFCAWCTPNDVVRSVLSASRDDVQQLASVAFDSMPGFLRVHTAFLLSMCGLRSNNEAGSRLIVRSAFEVHEALLIGAYSFQTWMLLSPELPNLRWWQDWDRCRKFITAVRNWFYANGIDASSLLTAADTDERRKLAHSILYGQSTPDEFTD